jgi:alanine-synthesizing transaminase
VFSSRLPGALAPNALARALAALRESGQPWLDLTETNPTAVGLPYPDDLLQPLADPGGVRYEPRPLGLESARVAVAEEYRRLGTPVASDRIVLTASTSEGYALLFKLLCNPGDEVLVPQPSYPLFDLLTRLDGVGARPYRLDYHGAWSIDRASLEAAMTARTRAVLIVSPNNPTGSMLRATDRDWLVNLCANRELPLIADEVFGDYPLSPRRDAARALCGGPALTFALGGLSKSAGLPQLKLGWIAVDGPDRRVREALQRLEIICDTYLSVSTAVQIAAPRLIDAGRSIRAAIAARLDRNLQYLRGAVARHASVSLLEPEGGWSAVVRVPATESEESLVLRLLDEARVLAHPGYFFDFSTEAFLVVSLLPATAAFAEAIDRVLSHVRGDLS